MTRWSFALILSLTGCDCLAPLPEPPTAEEQAAHSDEHIVNDDPPTQTQESDWVSSSEPEGLEPSQMGEWNVECEGPDCVLRGPGGASHEVTGPLRCSASQETPPRLACVPIEHESPILVDGEWLVPLHVLSDFFDDRTHGEIRWRRDELWMQRGDFWERVAIDEDEGATPSASEVQERTAALLSAAPEGFEALRGPNGVLWPAVVSPPVGLDAAHALHQRLSDDERAAVVVEDALLQQAPLDNAVRNLAARVLSMPAHALWAQLETQRQAWEAKVRERASEYGETTPPYASSELRRAQEQGAVIPRAGTPRGSSRYFVQMGRTRDAMGMGEPARYRVVVLEVDQAHWAPALVGFGGFNHCPYRFAHMIALRDWAAQHGARPVFLGHDTMELDVARPPQSHREILEAGYRHYLLVGEMPGPLVEIAAGTQPRQWFLWWD